MTAEKIRPLMCDRPPPPRSIAETGLGLNNLISLALKTMYVRGLETSSQLADALKLNSAIVNSLMDEIKERALIENLGLAGDSQHSEFRFSLLSKGREWAIEALGLSQYIGPTPVTLEDYHRQIERQRIRLEEIDRDSLLKGLEGLVVPEKLVRRLVYGPPGNGKTTIAEVIGGIFKQIIHIPYCLDVDGTTIKVFDTTLHKTVDDVSHPEQTLFSSVSLRIDDIDRRWVACTRPVIITGGELTLEMLDLSFNPHARYYEAPLHLKAIGGTFIVDDLGRQLVRPEDLLNRWITPMEKRVDYLTLNTGKTFSIPFDELLVFSTNLMPEDIMDPAFLRRIPYKVELNAPSIENYRTLFEMLCAQNDLEYRDEIADFVAHELQTTFEQPLSYFQPKFVVEQCIAACKYLGQEVTMNREFLVDAMENLSAKSETARGNGEARANGDGASHTAAKGVASQGFSISK
jgi:energy-coupling factor transporter ATP-binding protein EcfA2